MPLGLHGRMEFAMVGERTPDADGGRRTRIARDFGVHSEPLVRVSVVAVGEPLDDVQGVLRRHAFVDDAEARGDSMDAFHVVGAPGGLGCGRPEPAGARFSQCAFILCFTHKTEWFSL